MWLDGLAEAAAGLGVAVQICTATGYDAMEALRYPAVTNVRASMDYRDWPNHYVGSGSLLAWALAPSTSQSHPNCILIAS